ncbi:MAG: hypothetical protein IKO85_05050 [Bacteroidaceae bacterium]|nr:hypothetical protein [Bacteroidaceae bacterium]
MSAQKKFDYDGEDFYTAIGNLASRDYTDREIVQFIGEEIRDIINKRNDERIRKAEDEGAELPELESTEGIPDSLNPEVFSRMKNGEYDGWNEQENKLRSMLICQVLQRARAKLSLVYKGVYDKIALGKIKTKTTTKTVRQGVDKDGNAINDTTTTETIQELPPNLQAITMWRFHHDPDFRKALQQMKRMDISVEDKSIDKVKVNITYNKKEDIELQEQKK